MLTALALVLLEQIPKESVLQSSKAVSLILTPLVGSFGHLFQIRVKIARKNSVSVLCYGKGGEVEGGGGRGSGEGGCLLSAVSITSYARLSGRCQRDYWTNKSDIDQRW